MSEAADIQILKSKVSDLEREVSGLRSRCNEIEIRRRYDIRPALFLFGMFMLFLLLVVTATTIKRHTDRDDLHGPVPAEVHNTPTPLPGEVSPPVVSDQ